MPPKLEEKVKELFKMIDIDNSQIIDREETLKFWSKSFGKLNSKVLFEQVDKNNDGSIQFDEWMEYWRMVYKSGYSEDEIITELDNMMKGGTWVKLSNSVIFINSNVPSSHSFIVPENKTFFCNTIDT